MKAIVLNLITLFCVTACSATTGTTTSNLIAANPNPHLKTGDLILVKNFHYIGEDFTAVTKNSTTVNSRYYLPMNTKLNGK